MDLRTKNLRVGKMSEEEKHSKRWKEEGGERGWSVHKRIIQTARIVLVLGPITHMTSITPDAYSSPVLLLAEAGWGM